MWGHTESQRYHTRKDVMEVIFVWSLVEEKVCKVTTSLIPMSRKKTCLLSRSVENTVIYLPVGWRAFNFFFQRKTVSNKNIYWWDSVYTNVWNWVFYYCLLSSVPAASFPLKLVFKDKNSFSTNDTIFEIS